MLHVYHVFHILRGEGFKIQLIRNVKVGADCFRIVIDNNRFIAFPGKSPGGMHGAIVEFDTLADTDRAGTQNENLFARIRFHGFIFPAVYGIIVRGARFKFCGAGIHHFIRGNDTVVITLLLNLFRRDSGKTADNRIRKFDPFRFSEKFRSERAFGKSLFHFHDNGYLINKPMIHHGDFMDRVIIDSLTDGFGYHIDSLVIHFFQTLFQFFHGKL